MSGSGISWAICKSAPRSRQITTAASHHSVFYRQDALPAAQPTASKHWRRRNQCYYFSLAKSCVLRHCWLGGRKGIRPVKNWAVECWCGYQSGARCRLAYGPADATATHCLLLQQSRLVLPFWYRLTQVVPDKGPLNVCVCVCKSCVSSNTTACFYRLPVLFFMQSILYTSLTLHT